MNNTLLPPPPMDETGLDMSQFRLYDPIIPLRSPMNRREKRAMEMEYNKLFKMLYPIEKAFVTVSKNPLISYMGTYQYCLRRFQFTCDFIKIHIKPKWFTVNNQYFRISFKADPSA